MTASELYELLDNLGLTCHIVEIHEGVRVISFEVDEEVEDEQ